MRLAALCVAAALAGSVGCVSKSKYKGVVAELEASEKKRAAAEAENQRLSGALDSEKREAERLRTDMEAQLEATEEELGELRRQRAAQKRELAEFQTLTRRFRSMIDAGKLKVYVRRGRMIVSLPSSVLFKSGDAQLSPRGEKALTQVADTLKTLKKRRFLVAGHTDSIKVKKSGFVDNWELSTVRALNVTRYLIQQGMNPRMLAAAGYGRWDPVKNNRSAGGRARNRRIELVLMPRIPPIPRKLLEGLPK